MLWYTHLAFGILSALVVLPFVNVPSKLLFVIIVGFGSLLPDVDHEKSKINQLCPVTRIFPKLFKHRGFFHSVFAALLILGIFWYFGEKFVGLAITFGYLTHLLSDSFTRMGINPLHPFSKLRFRGPFRTGGLSELCFFIAIVGLIVIKVLL